MATPITRVRRSVQDLQADYDAGNRFALETVVRAFKGLIELKPDDIDSFFMIAGYHGEPFRDPNWNSPKTPPGYWGGFCNHANVLFPTWHRAYLLRLENAMRCIPGCEDVAIPFWDELLGKDTATPIPKVFTEQYFFLDGERILNPLYSYQLQSELKDAEGENHRYDKPAGYNTCRYPQSGLVGTPEDREKTKVHNARFASATKNAELLNGNVAAWLNGTVKITDDDEHTRQPDTSSVFERFMACMQAPDYTRFSNTRSAAAYNAEHKIEKKVVIPVESPHNAMHLAVGGFYQKGKYNADPILGANGDMGENNTASMDPIFFFHHAFIDYAFWRWQEKTGVTKKGSLTIEKGYPGTNTGDESTPDIPPDTDLTTTTPLYPFRRDLTSWYTTENVTDIENDLGYTYGPGTLDPISFGAPKAEPTPERVIKIANINRAQIKGSFVVRLYATLPSGEKVEIGKEPILSRWNLERCANCQVSLPVETYTALPKALATQLEAAGFDTSSKEGYDIELQTHGDSHLSAPHGSMSAPTIEV